jgi:hypothetical protein
MRRDEVPHKIQQKENLIVAQLAKIFPAFYRPQRLITVFPRVPPPNSSLS